MDIIKFSLMSNFWFYSAIIQFLTFQFWFEKKWRKIIIYFFSCWKHLRFIILIQCLFYILNNFKTLAIYWSKFHCYVAKAHVWWRFYLNALFRFRKSIEADIKVIAYIRAISNILFRFYLVIIQQTLYLYMGFTHKHKQKKLELSLK